MLAEPESAQLEDRLSELAGGGDRFAASELAAVEVARALRSRLDLDVETPEYALALDQSLTAVAMSPIDGQVVAAAQVIGPPALRSLDAMHLATALLLRVDLLISYDQRMLDVAAGLGILTERP